MTYKHDHMRRNMQARPVISIRPICSIDGYVDSMALFPTLDDCHAKVRRAIARSHSYSYIVLRNVDVRTNADLLLLLDILCMADCSLFDVTEVHFIISPDLKRCLTKWAPRIREYNRNGIVIIVGEHHYWDVMSYIAALEIVEPYILSNRSGASRVI